MRAALPDIFRRQLPGRDYPAPSLRPCRFGDFSPPHGGKRRASTREEEQASSRGEEKLTLLAEGRTHRGVAPSAYVAFLAVRCSRDSVAPPAAPFARERLPLPLLWIALAFSFSEKRKGSEEEGGRGARGEMVLHGRGGKGRARRCHS